MSPQKHTSLETFRMLLTSLSYVDPISPRHSMPSHVRQATSTVNTQGGPIAWRQPKYQWRGYIDTELFWTLWRREKMPYPTMNPTTIPYSPPCSLSLNWLGYPTSFNTVEIYLKLVISPFYQVFYHQLCILQNYINQSSITITEINSL